MQHFLEPVASIFYNLRLPPAYQCKMAKAALKVRTSVVWSAGFLLPGYTVPTTALQILQGKIPLVFSVYVLVLFSENIFVPPPEPTSASGFALLSCGPQCMKQNGFCQGAVSMSSRGVSL